MKNVTVVCLFAISAAAQMTNTALLQLDRDFARATAQEHLDGWMKYMMPSTVIFGLQVPDQRIVGKDEIRSYYQSIFAMPDFTMVWTPTSAQVLPSGMTGFTEGTFHWIIPSSLCKCTNDWHGTYLAVWEVEHVAGSKWKLKALFPDIEGTSVTCGCGAP